MMRREGDRVLIDISKDEYLELLLMLGYAIGAASRPFQKSWLRLVNSINEGNPQFTPYEIPE